MKEKSETRLGIYVSANLLAHDTGPGHPESQERYQAVLDMVEQCEFAWTPIEKRRATIAEITLAHSASYHDIARQDVENLAQTLRTGDTSVSEDSYEVALEATGSVLNGIDQIFEGKLDRVFCATRPPGHHATPDRGMGFCIFNHIAIGARYAQVKHGVKRVALLDWDVHHGNGTQDITWNDPTLFFFSTHQEFLYPGTGLRTETGGKDAPGSVLNIPLPEGSGDKEVLQAWGEPLREKLAAFQPQLILVSAGFDASAEDPLGGLTMTPEGFAAITKLVRSYADEYCDGKLLSVLEGGYNHQSLQNCLRAHLGVMADEG